MPWAMRPAKGERPLPVTDELYDIILFLTHSFVRPIVSELYAIEHTDVTVAESLKRLIVVVRDGKTGFRTANTMPGAVAVYERTRKRNRDARDEDYIFLPRHQNRITACRIIQRQFKELLTRAKLEDDPISGMKHTNIRCVTPRSACGLFCQRVRSIFSILQRTQAPRSIRLSGSTLEISHSPRKWRSTCRVSEVLKTMFYARIRKINPSPIQRSRDLDF